MIKLREKRLEKKMTQKELASRVKYADPTVDQATISVLERGELYPSESLRDALCKVLECTEEDLYDGIEALFVPSVSREFSKSTKVIAGIFEMYPGQKIPRKVLLNKVTACLGWMSDRSMRRLIEKARQEGFVIKNDQDGSGYYIPDTIEELKGLLKQNNSRAMSVLKQNKHIRERIRAKEAARE